jgi:hypothetical protein
MSRIKSLYREYFQKSRVFLYPVLDIKRGNSIVPVNTYIAWEQLGIEPKDAKMVCVYQYRTDQEYLDFETQKLKGNKLYESSTLINDGSEIAYIFSFNPYKQDWLHFLNGKYSKMSIPFKRKIKDFFRQSGNNYVYVESFLHPEKYFALYSELLNMPMSELKEVGELCSPPDVSKESLSAELHFTLVTTKTNHDE